jgi:hypothetical protein
MAEKEPLKLEKEELEILQKLNKDFQTIKVQLGDLAIQKNNVLKSLDVIQNMFKNEEKKLVEKYGEKAVINIETGEIKEAEEEENKE